MDPTDLSSRSGARKPRKHFLATFVPSLSWQKIDFENQKLETAAWSPGLCAAAGVALTLLLAIGAKTVFCPTTLYIYIQQCKHDHFTKTGSGQT